MREDVWENAVKGTNKDKQGQTSTNKDKQRNARTKKDKQGTNRTNKDRHELAGTNKANQRQTRTDKLSTGLTPFSPSTILCCHKMCLQRVVRDKQVPDPKISPKNPKKLKFCINTLQELVFRPQNTQDHVVEY